MSQNPLHHVLDERLFGLSNTGEWVWLWKYPPGLADPTLPFTPARLGPFDLTFTKHMAGISLVTLAVFLVMSLVARRVRESVTREGPPRGRLANIIEAMVLFVKNEVVLPILGPAGTRYIPIFLTFFFFILCCNLFGMIPEVGTPTGNINVTFTLAALIFIAILVLGSFEQGGPHRFLLSLVPPGVPFWLWPMMFLLELIGPIAKCFALMMRLFANMIAGHIVIAALLGLALVFKDLVIPVGIAGTLGAVAMGLLEVFICVLQAYIFTLLSVIFIGAAVHPEH